MPKILCFLLLSTSFSIDGTQVGKAWIEEFKQLPAEKQAEFWGGLAAGAVFGKPIGAIQMKLLGVGLGAAARGASGFAKRVVGVIKKAPKFVAETPEGLKVPIKVAGEVERAEGAAGGLAARDAAMLQEDEDLAKTGGAAKPPAKMPKEKKIPADQVIKREDRPIRVKRVDYESLARQLANKAAKAEKPLFDKANLKHIFGIDKKVKFRAGGEIEGSYSGYHHDKDFSLVKKGKVKFLSEPKVCPKTGAIKVERLSIEGVIKTDQTFFPSEWSQSHTLDKIIEASENIVDTVKDGETCLEVIGKTSEGLEVFLVIRKVDKFLITVYPELKGL